jgi:hypothetical protein
VSKLSRYAKFITAATGALITIIGTSFAATAWAPQAIAILTAAGTVATAAAVYLVPNAPTTPNAPKGGNPA